MLPYRLETTSKSVDKTHKWVYCYDMTIVILLLKYTNHAFTYTLQNILILFVFRILEATVAVFCINKPHYNAIIGRHCFKGDKHDCEQGQISAATVLLFW